MRAKNTKTELTAEQATTLLTHVRELQVRLLVTAAVLVAAGVVAYLYYGQILDLLRAPLNAPLYYNSVSGSFSFIMKICLVAGIAVSVPLIVYNFIMFVRPAFLEVFTIKRVILMTLGSVLAAAGGIVFGFSFIIPGALHFFSGFQVHGLHELISADSYLNFVINVLITFILMFQLPLVVSLIDRIKPISPRAMWKGEKWALIGSVVIAAIVPFAMDLTTQALIAAPIFLLYNLSFVVIAVQHGYRKKLAQKAARVEARAERKVARTAAPAKPVRVPSPVLATRTLAPHPQLAEVIALQADVRPHAPAAKHIHQPQMQRTAVVMRPVAAPKPVVKPLLVAQPKPSTPAQPALRPTKAVSMDGMSIAAAPTVNRAQPTYVIRRAGTITPPQRQAQRPMRPVMLDIR